MLVECQRNPYLKELATRVVSCRQSDRGWEVILTDTVLYPEGGGQPSDYGTVNGIAIHHVERASGGEVIHVAEKSVDQGDAVVTVDWARRYDHMQQHTAQHLITALVQDEMGFETLSFHLGQERCDIVLDTNKLSVSQLETIETMANDAIRGALPVSHRTVEVADMEGLNIRTRGLPEGFEGAVRLVEIQGLDLNTCGGTHVASTAELQAIVLTGTESVSQGTRLYFVAGQRVLAMTRRQRMNERQLTELLSVGSEQHLEAVNKVMADGAAARKASQRLLQSLADSVAGELVASEASVLSHHQRDADLSYLNRVAQLVHGARKGAVLLLTAGAPTGVGLMLLAGPANVVSSVSTEVSRILAAKGGGRPGLFQGRATALNHRDDALAYLKATVPAVPPV